MTPEERQAKLDAAKALMQEVKEDEAKTPPATVTAAVELTAELAVESVASETKRVVGIVEAHASQTVPTVEETYRKVASHMKGQN